MSVSELHPISIGIKLTTGNDYIYIQESVVYTCLSVSSDLVTTTYAARTLPQ